MYKVLDTGLLKIPGTIAEIAPLAVKYGFEGINVPRSALAAEKLAAEAAACVREYGLKWGLLPTATDYFNENTGDEAFNAALATQEKWAKTGEKLGVRYAYNHIWPSSSKRDFDDNFEWHIGRLRRLMEVFNRHGIKYGLEFLGPFELRSKHIYPFVHTISGVLAIADAAAGSAGSGGTAKAGFLFDTYHWYCGSRRLDDLYYAAQNCHRMVNMHANDAMPGIPPDEQRDMVRALPMTTGVIDSAMIYQLFRQSGYAGPVICEPMTPATARFAAAPPEQSVAEIAEAFRRMEND